MLAFISIQYLRCFETINYHFHPQLNLIIGQNGSGKTALLEAIALLSRGHSFRNREISPLIQTNQSTMTVFGRLFDAQTISIKKEHSATPHIQLNGQRCMRTSELAQILPAQVIYQDIFQIIQAGPETRRSLIDWGLFHINPAYHVLCKQYRQALKQRNMLLKQQAPPSAFYAWNDTLSTLGQSIHESRKTYLMQLMPRFQSTLSELSSMTCHLHYYKGWDQENKGLSLADTLVECYDTDLKQQYTRYGIHHADLQFLTSHGQAKAYLSRGQQKILLLALKIAQAQLLNKPCLYLWDDIGAELDHVHMSKLAHMIQSISGQFFITGLQLTQSPWYQAGLGSVIQMPPG